MDSEAAEMDLAGNPNISTYPYVVVKGIPTYETDYQSMANSKPLKKDKMEAIVIFHIQHLR